MSIDAVISSVRHRPYVTELRLRPRIDSDGRPTIAGQDRLYISRNPDYTPRPGDEIWGSSVLVISKDGTDHKYRRIAKLWDGTFREL